MAVRGSIANSAALRLWLLAAIVVVLTLVTPFAFRAGGDNVYMAFGIATGFAAFAAMIAAQRAPQRNALWLIAGVAVLLRGILLLTDPLLSDDVYRYVWDGKVQAAGINPYRYFPVDEALASLRDPAIYPNINRADDAVTIYPPVAQMFFFLVTRFGESIVTMKLAMLACEAVTVTMIVLLLRRLGRPITRIVAYAWHPLPMWEIANNGHVDALMTALMMLGIWLAFAGWPLRGAAAIALGALAKPFAIFALPAIWRPWDWRPPLTILLVAAVCYAPYLSVGWGVFGYLTTGYLQEEHLDTGNNIWLLAIWRQIVGSRGGDFLVYLGISALTLVTMALVMTHRERGSIETSVADINRLLLAFLFLLSPNYPWYFLVATPFVALCGGAPVWVMTVAALLMQEEVLWDAYVPVMIRKSIQYGAFLLACAYVVCVAWKIPPREKLDDEPTSV